jgi:carbamoyl-phosphate synthase small subunit
MTAPHIGNTGMNDFDMESDRIWVAGFVVRNPSPRVSNWRSEYSLEDALIKSGVVGIQGVDTRAITRHLRDRGAMRVGIFSGAEYSRDEMVVKVRNSEQMSGAFLAKDVTTAKKYVVEVPKGIEKKFTVAALDLGIKRATPRSMSERGMEVHVFPLHATADEIMSIHPDGLFISNGPGDPATMTSTVDLVREFLTNSIPVFGICFGHQILGRALGFDTYKLPFGHRGINQPVKNLQSGKVEITAHNHGFAVDAPTEGNFSTVFGSGFVSHICLNDGVVEGLELLERPAFSVQYHPESAAGPHDAQYLFDHFADIMAKSSASRGAHA